MAETSGFTAGDGRAENAGRRAAVVFVPPIIVFVLVIALWTVVSYGLLDPRRRFLLPPPQSVVKDGLIDSAARAELLQGLWSTAQVALIGLAIAAAAGIGLAVAMSQARWVERSLYPWAVVLQTVPILALVPVIGFWWGFDLPSRVLVCVIIALFPIITNTLFGLKSAELSLHDLFTLHHAGRLTRLRKLLLPHALPAIFTGLRIAAGLSVVGAIVGDFFFRQGEPGIGRLLDNYRANLQSEKLFAAVFLSSLLGLIVFWFFGWLGSRLIRGWHDSTWAGR